MFTIKHTILITLLLMLSTSVAIAGKSNQSYAMQIAKAGKINEGLHDMREDKLNQLIKVDEGTPIISGTLAAGYATGIFDAPGGLSNIGTSLVFAWDALLRDRTKDSQYTQILAWMPQEMAKDKKQAAIKLNEYLANALLKAAPENYELTGPENAKALWGWEKDENKYIKILGPECKGVCFASFRSLNFEPGSLPKSKKMPKFIGSGKSWFWGNRVQKLRISEFKDSKEYPLKDFNYSFYQRISENLPEWAFVYVAPDKYKPIPAIFHQGKMFLFVKSNQKASNESSAASEPVLDSLM